MTLAGGAPDVRHQMGVIWAGFDHPQKVRRAPIEKYYAGAP